MSDLAGRFLDTESLSPHGICLLWRPELIWAHMISDALIGLAYFSIPVALGVFVTKRRDIAFGWIFWCFALFILACGTTHFFAIWTLFVPDYGAEALVKILTAVISLATAATLWPLLPRALALPSPEELRRMNAALTARITERDAALDALRLAIDERERAEAMLRQSQKMEAIGQFTGGVAHDFNNLLGVIIGNLERLQRLLPGNAAAEKPLQSAMEGAERAAGLVRDLLAFARQQPLVPTRVDANHLVRCMLDLIEGALSPSGRLVVDLEPDLWPTCVDRNQLESVVLNLAVNARDAMEPDGTFTVATRNLAREAARAQPPLQDIDYVHLRFSDTGRGMAPEVAERAIEPFFTTKPVGRGTGLGLSQVFGFVKQSGGHLALHSRPGAGTTIDVYLPRENAAPPRAAALSEPSAEPIGSMFMTARLA
ncbi:sensor histidine kinase [Methylobacterium sp. ID0610]|uniref:sensor histidine kinase n=1 Tax=Methylobacterium carpenticola TaxID=3344827 RepID=UPI0036779926